MASTRSWSRPSLPKSRRRSFGCCGTRTRPKHYRPVLWKVRACASRGTGRRPSLRRCTAYRATLESKLSFCCFRRPTGSLHGMRREQLRLLVIAEIASALVTWRGLQIGELLVLLLPRAANAVTFGLVIPVAIVGAAIVRR